MHRRAASRGTSPRHASPPWLPPSTSPRGGSPTRRTGCLPGLEGVDDVDQRTEYLHRYRWPDRFVSAALTDRPAGISTQEQRSIAAKRKGAPDGQPRQPSPPPHQPLEAPPSRSVEEYDLTPRVRRPPQEDWRHHPDLSPRPVRAPLPPAPMDQWPHDPSPRGRDPEAQMMRTATRQPASTSPAPHRQPYEVTAQEKTVKWLCRQWELWAQSTSRAIGSDDEPPAPPDPPPPGTVPEHVGEIADAASFAALALLRGLSSTRAKQAEVQGTADWLDKELERSQETSFRLQDALDELMERRDGAGQLQNATDDVPEAADDAPHQRVAELEGMLIQLREEKEIELRREREESERQIKREREAVEFYKKKCQRHQGDDDEEETTDMWKRKMEVQVKRAIEDSERHVLQVLESKAQQLRAPQAAPQQGGDAGQSAMFMMMSQLVQNQCGRAHGASDANAEVVRREQDLLIRQREMAMAEEFAKLKAEAALREEEIRKLKEQAARAPRGSVIEVQLREQAADLEQRLHQTLKVQEEELARRQEQFEQEMTRTWDEIELRRPAVAQQAAEVLTLSAQNEISDTSTNKSRWMDGLCATEIELLERDQVGRKDGHGRRTGRIDSPVDRVRVHGTWIAIYTERQLQEMHQADLREYAVLLHSTIGRERIGSRVPDENADLVVWILDVTRRFLVKLRREAPESLFRWTNQPRDFLDTLGRLEYEIKGMRRTVASAPDRAGFCAAARRRRFADSSDECSMAGSWPSTGRFSGSGAETLHQGGIPVALNHITMQCDALASDLRRPLLPRCGARRHDHLCRDFLSRGTAGAKAGVVREAVAIVHEPSRDDPLHTEVST